MNRPKQLMGLDSTNASADLKVLLIRGLQSQDMVVFSEQDS
jgi:hypothetical protein